MMLLEGKASVGKPEMRDKVYKRALSITGSNNMR